MPGGRYRVRVRSGSRVERHRFDDRGAALSALELLGDSLAENADAKPVDIRTRQFEPVAQVVARLELAGPRRLRAGVDVRGDGSVESYEGVLRRRVIEQRPGESAYEALARVLAARG